MHRPKNPKAACSLRAWALPGPLKEFRSRKSEAASPNRRCSQADQTTPDLAGLRRGLASIQFTTHTAKGAPYQKVCGSFGILSGYVAQPHKRCSLRRLTDTRFGGGLCEIPNGLEASDLEHGP
jgi:hypothetical protein